MSRVSVPLMLWCVVLAAQYPAEGGVVFSGVTYMSEGKQYVAIAAGSALIVFALDR